MPDALLNGSNHDEELPALDDEPDSEEDGRRRRQERERVDAEMTRKRRKEDAW